MFAAGRYSQSMVTIYFLQMGAFRMILGALAILVPIWAIEQGVKDMTFYRMEETAGTFMFYEDSFIVLR